MKKFTLIAVAFCITVFLFCCKTYKDTILPAEEEIVDNEISDYLNSAKGIMHNAPVAQPDPHSTTAATEKAAAIPLDRHAYKIPVLPTINPPGDNEPVLTKKQERKALKALLKKKVAADRGDGEGIGIAIGLLILYIALAILIIVLLWVLIANSVNQSTNSSSNGGSGSNSNSGNSGNSGGSGSNSGCYVATMVYGSYDAPEVMVLRRFRDDTLSHSKAGRAFIRWYYSWSPGFVAKYHHLSWLHAIIKVVLNRLVKFLS
jgi:hypothetical protein